MLYVLHLVSTQSCLSFRKVALLEVKDQSILLGRKYWSKKGKPTNQRNKQKRKISNCPNSLLACLCLKMHTSISRTCTFHRSQVYKQCVVCVTALCNNPPPSPQHTTTCANKISTLWANHTTNQPPTQPSTAANLPPDLAATVMTPVRPLSAIFTRILINVLPPESMSDDISNH